MAIGVGGRRGPKGIRRLVDADPLQPGQILYRVAEMLEGRREQFIAEVQAAEGANQTGGRTFVDTSTDRWVWCPGWADKIAQVSGSANAVGGPYFDSSVPEPTGVVAIVATSVSVDRPGRLRRTDGRHRQHRGRRVVVRAADPRRHAVRNASHTGRRRPTPAPDRE